MLVSLIEITSKTANSLLNLPETTFPIEDYLKSQSDITNITLLGNGQAQLTTKYGDLN